MSNPKSEGNLGEVGYKKPPKQHQFKKGQGGRKKGSRNKLTKNFVNILHRDFKENGQKVIEDLRRDKPDVYAKIIAGFVPKEVEATVDASLNVTEIKRVVVNASNTDS